MRFLLPRSGPSGAVHERERGVPEGGWLENAPAYRPSPWLGRLRRSCLGPKYASTGSVFLPPRHRSYRCVFCVAVSWPVRLLSLVLLLLEVLQLNYRYYS